MRRRRHGGSDRGEGRPLIAIRPITTAEARSVRWPILRAGRPESDCHFPQDDFPDTVHLGAFDGARLVGVATFFPDRYPGRESISAWRLRGMATLAAERGRGAGGLLVERGVEIARERGARLVWCNGRLDAAGFYLKVGFAIDGGLFDPHGTGPHHRMIREIPAGA